MAEFIENLLDIVFKVTEEEKLGPLGVDPIYDKLITKATELNISIYETNDKRVLWRGMFVPLVAKEQVEKEQVRVLIIILRRGLSNSLRTIVMAHEIGHAIDFLNCNKKVRKADNNTTFSFKGEVIAWKLGKKLLKEYGWTDFDYFHTIRNSCLQGYNDLLPRWKQWLLKPRMFLAWRTQISIEALIDLMSESS